MWSGAGRLVEVVAPVSPSGAPLSAGQFGPAAESGAVPGRARKAEPSRVGRGKRSRPGPGADSGAVLQW